MTNLDYIYRHWASDPSSSDETSGVRDVDFDVQRQLGPVLLCALDKRPPSHSPVHPHDILSRKDQAELEFSDERK